MESVTWGQESLKQGAGNGSDEHGDKHKPSAACPEHSHCSWNVEGAPKPARGARAVQHADFCDVEKAKGPFLRPQKISASEFDTLCN